MKVLLINGSAHAKGSTFRALSEVSDNLNQCGVETEILQCGAGPIRDCTGCYKCAGSHCCVYKDDMVNDWIDKAKGADGFVFGTPVYYAHPNGRIQSVLDRMFFAGGKFLQNKPGAAVAVARRGGTAASLDALNKYFTINSMPVVSSTYWNMVFGRSAEDVQQDLEGLQTMRNLGRNMAWLLRCIEAGAAQGIPLPEREREHHTSFIR